MLADLLDSALALLLGPLAFVLPGYAVGWVSDVLGFRARTLPVRVATSLMLSVAVGPILVYFLLHLSWTVLGGFWVVLGGIAAFHLVRERPSPMPLVRPALAGITLAVVLVLLVVDIGWGDRLYFSVVARDYLKHFALTEVIRAGGVPPTNPYFVVAGEALPLFYYYGWLLMTSLLDAFGGALVGPRGAVFAGTAWVGLALAATAAVYAVTLPNPLLKGAPSTLQRAYLAAALLLVGGLDLVMFLAGMAGMAALGYPVVFTDIEWWNEPLFLWITSVLTVPHHTAGLIAALAGLRIARWGVDASGRARWGAMLVAGAAFASSALCSVWVAMGTAVVGVVWVLVNALRRRWTEVRGWLAAGVAAGVLALPYVLDLRAAGSGEGSPLAMGVRPFGPLERFADVPRLGLGALLHLPFLPVAYALELGFVALAGGLFWRARRRLGTPLTPDERLLRVVFWVALVFPIFVLANLRQNDLGFRVPMLMQFVLLLWSLDWIEAYRQGAVSLPRRWLRPVLAALLAVGVASTVANGLVIRFVPPAADAGLVAMPPMYSPDRQLGARTAALRAAYDWVQTQTPEGAVVQHHPQPGVPRTEGGLAFPPSLYARRPFAAYDDDMGTLFSVPFARYTPVAEDLAAAFEQPEAGPAAAAAQQHGVAAYVVTDRDPVWNDPASWVWTHPPDFANAHARVFLDPAHRLATAARPADE